MALAPLLALSAALSGCHSDPLSTGDGAGGAGGASDAPDPFKGWRASASSSSLDGKPGDDSYDPPENALDGDPATRWSSGKPQAADEWFQLDFGQTLSVDSLDLDMGDDPSDSSYDDYPRGYFVRLSEAPNDETADVIASGAGKTPVTHINLRGLTGRYVYIRQTFVDDHWWSIHELRASVSFPAP